MKVDSDTRSFGVLLMSNHESQKPLGTDKKSYGNTLQLQVIRSVEQMSDLRDEWEKLVLDTGSHIYQTFDWALLWWKHFGVHPKRELNVLVVRHGKQLVGIIPLFKEHYDVFGFPLARRLRLIGCGVPHVGSFGMLTEYSPSDYLDAIVLPEHIQAVVTCFVDYLASPHNDYTEVKLENVPGDSFFVREVTRELEKRAMRYLLTHQDECPRLAVPKSLDEFFSGLQAGVRRRLVQAHRASGEDGLFAIESINDESAFLEAFDHLKRLHQLRWNSMGTPGLFTDRAFERFQRDVALAFMRQGRLWFKLARVNGSVIAARLGFKINGCFYDYLTGFDNRVPEARRRPGMALLVAMIEDAARDGAETVDLLRGTENYKLELTSNSSRTWQVTIKKPNTQHAFQNLLWTIAEGLLHVKHRLGREYLLLRVFYQQHGLPSFLHRYLVFRMQKLTRIAMKQSQQKPEVADKESSSWKETPSEIFDGALSRHENSLLDKIARSLERDKDLSLWTKIRKGFVFLRSMVMSKLYLHAVDNVGRAARTRGRPYIDNLGRIVIGNGFNLNSRIVRSELATGPKGTIEIGDDVSINFGASISAQTRVKIGNRVRIGPYAMIIDSDFHTPGGDRYSKPTGEPITIEDDVWLGGRVTVLKGTTIGTRSVITAGSVVSGVIPPDVVAGGVPARVIRRLKTVPEEQVDERLEKTTTDNQVAQRVKSVFSKTFGLSDSVDPSWGQAQIAQWDSLGHLNLIMALESEFGVTLTEDDMVNITTVRSACDIIERHMTGNTEPS